MDKATIQLLHLLTAAMGTKEEYEEAGGEDWSRLYSLATSHNIVPMIYEALWKNNIIPSNSYDQLYRWKDFSTKSSMLQLHRTMEFLTVCNKLSEAGIRALVIKGIILRQLYPNHYYRSSCDEDVYIQRDDLLLVEELLKDSGMFPVSNKKEEACGQVITYRSPQRGLEIELHTDLFNAETKLFGPMNAFFEKAFQHSITVIIDGVEIHTLSHDMHLLFLILHSIKHFLTTGFGIRQVCDLVMYINVHGGELNWGYIWEKVTILGYEIFLLNLLDIGVKYLGLNNSKIEYPKELLMEDIHSEALLEDIMKSGIFGKSSPEQIRTSSMTLQAISEAQCQKVAFEEKQIFRKTLFPGIDYMRRGYPYCRNSNLLLPLAWVHRILSYAAENKRPVRMLKRARSSFKIGKRRIRLLKEYRMIRI